MIKFVGIQGEASEVATFLNEWKGGGSYTNVQELMASVEETKTEDTVEVEKPKKSKQTKPKKVEVAEDIEVVTDKEIIEDAFDNLPDESEKKETPQEDIKTEEEKVEKVEEVFEEETVEPMKFEVVADACKKLCSRLKSDSKKYPAPTTIVRAIATIYGGSTFVGSLAGMKPERYNEVYEAIRDTNCIKTLDNVLSVLEKMGVKKDPEKAKGSDKADYAPIQELYENLDNKQDDDFEI